MKGFLAMALTGVIASTRAGHYVGELDAMTRGNATPTFKDAIRNSKHRYHKRKFKKKLK